jgi:hypothetical protein
MTVMAREVWTDERLDDLNKRVDEGFKETREEFRTLRSEIKGEFQASRGEFAAQFALLHQAMYRLFGGMIVAWVVGIVAILIKL